MNVKSMFTRHPVTIKEILLNNLMYYFSFTNVNSINEMIVNVRP